jgi:hypothetical protein
MRFDLDKLRFQAGDPNSFAGAKSSDEAPPGLLFLPPESKPDLGTFKSEQIPTFWR